MVDYMPDIEIVNNKKVTNIYSSFGGKNYVKGSSVENNNILL